MRLWIRWCVVLCGLSLGFVSGCGPTPEQQKAAEEAKKPVDVKLGETSAPPEEEDEPKAPAKDAKAPAKKAAPEKAAGTTELKVGNGKLTFQVPGSWKKVDPASQIIEAELHLPKVGKDEFDGRLTLMPAGGDLEANIQRWEKEFTPGTLRDTKKETSTVAGKSATWVDLRGEWTGSAMRPVPPRKEYRMLSVVIPLDGGQAYFIKLTGPQETVAANEEAFRAFVNSAKLADK